MLKICVEKRQLTMLSHKGLVYAQIRCFMEIATGDFVHLNTPIQKKCAVWDMMVIMTYTVK